MEPAIHPSILWAAELIKTMIVLAVMLYASWLDLRTREVEPRIWLYASIPLAGISVGEAYILVPSKGSWYMAMQIAGSLIGVAFMAALYYAGMMGGGDLFASIMILAAHPWPPFLRTIIPFLLDALIYSAAAFLAVVPAVMLYNMLFHWEELRRIKGLKHRIVAAATAIPMTIGRYVESNKWFFPLEDYRFGEPRFRLSFDIDEDPEEHRRILRRLLENGAVSRDERIWVTYGVPFLIPLTAGYAAGLVWGDRLVVMLLRLAGIIP